MHIVLLFNPKAGSADALADADVLAPLRGHGRRLRLVASRTPRDLEAQAARAVRDGATHVVAAGGDGTLNAVVNGVARVRGGLSRVALGLLPLGTGNDFARALDVPRDLPAAIELLLRGRERRLDAARLNDRLFLNASGGGFTAETSAHVSGRLKAWVGRLAYLVGGAQALRAHVPVLTDVQVDGVGHLLPLQLFAVCNGRTLGGGHTLAPDVEPDDGWLDVCMVHGTSKLDLVALLPVLSSGRHVQIGEASVLHMRARRLSLRFAVPTLVNVDGEVDVQTRCHYEVLPGAVRFVC